MRRSIESERPEHNSPLELRYIDQVQSVAGLSGIWAVPVVREELHDSVDDYPSLQSAIDNSSDDTPVVTIPDTVADREAVVSDRLDPGAARTFALADVHNDWLLTDGGDVQIFAKEQGGTVIGSVGVPLAAIDAKEITGSTADEWLSTGPTKSGITFRVGASRSTGYRPGRRYLGIPRTETVEYMREHSAHAGRRLRRLTGCTKIPNYRFANHLADYASLGRLLLITPQTGQLSEFYTGYVPISNYNENTTLRIRFDGYGRPATRCCHRRAVVGTASAYDFDDNDVAIDAPDKDFEVDDADDFEDDEADELEADGEDIEVDSDDTDFELDEDADVDYEGDEESEAESDDDLDFENDDTGIEVTTVTSRSISIKYGAYSHQQIPYGF